MPKTKAHYDHTSVEILQRQCVYDGFFKMDKLQLRHRLFGGGWSQRVTRELFVRGEAVAGILYDPQNDLIGLVEQFRVGALNQDTGPWCLEVVAGIAEPGETPEEVMLRELKEEANLVPSRLLPICSYLSSPGGSDEKLHLFCAICDLSHAGGIYGLNEEEEDILVRVFATDSVFDTMLEGRTNNAATLIALQWLQWKREDLATMLNSD